MGKLARREADRKQAETKALHDAKALSLRTQQQAMQDEAVRLAASVEWNETSQSEVRKFLESGRHPARSRV